MTRCARNAAGLPIGEAHPRARLLDHEVDLLLELRDTGGMSLAELGRKFDVSKSCVAHIVAGRRRGQTPDHDARPGTCAKRAGSKPRGQEQRGLDDAGLRLQLILNGWR